MNSVIRLISTGGTIDSSPAYSPEKKSVFDGTYISAMLEHARFTVPITHEPLLQKDSADITEADRALLFDRCAASAENHIVITHGTDTMPETARFLGEKHIQKTIVLVGSFVPFSQPDSDALANIGYALAAAQLLPTGVWVTMNGKVFSSETVRKDRENKIFIDT